VSDFLKTFLNKMFDTFLSFIVYIVGSLVLMIGILSFVTGKFPPPFQEILKNVQQMKQTMQELSAFQGTLQAQNKRKKLDEVLQSSLEDSVKINQVDENKKFQDSLRVELEFIKSQIKQAQYDIEFLRRTCQPVANKKNQDEQKTAAH
jgi:hypothetical protein